MTVVIATDMDNWIWPLRSTTWQASTVLNRSSSRLSISIRNLSISKGRHCVTLAWPGPIWVLATFYHDLGEFEKALFHHRKAQEMYLAKYGKMHPAMAEIHQNMGAVYGSQGKLQQA